jgi:uncharacterized repeat protein (TIGR01451 family)
VRPVADLSLTKSDAPDPVLAGEELTYTLTVDNAGPRSATGVQLTDTLPATTTFVSAVPSQGSCSESAGTVTCALDTIADEGSASVEIKVTPQEGGTITNQAAVTSDEGDPSPASNTASADTAVSPAADLELTKSDSPDPVPAGGLLTYTLGVHNAGPSSAAAVQLTDTLPAGVTFESATPSQGSCSETAGIVDCGLGTLADEANASVVIKIRPQSTGTITNQANVLSLALDADMPDNSASAETTVVPAADLSLTKTDSPDPLLLGQQLTYTLTVQNSGPETATAVSLTDTLPGDVTFDSATPTQGSCSESAGTVTCALDAIADAGSASVEIKVTPQATGTIINEATVSSEVGDPNTADNSASVQTTVDPVADLSVSKSDSPDPILVEELLTYSLSVHNAGPSSAAGVSLTDDLPAGVTFDSAVPSQGTCSEESGVVTCTFGTLADEDTVTVEIKVRPQAAGSISNQADVTSDTHDPASADNSASTETTVNRVADLSLTKSDSPDPAVVNEQVTYTLSIHNSGPSNATGVSVTDTLPGGVNYESATPSQGTCSEAAGTVSCALGTVTNGSDATVTIRIRPQSAGAITNEASVTSDATDPSSGNDSASAETTVNAAVGYARPKSAAPVSVPFVPAYSLCASPNRIHGPPLADPSCNPPARASTYLTTGTPDANGAPANSTGSAKFVVIVDPPDNDVSIRATITDVRCGSGTSACGTTNTQSGPDYTGELQLVLPMRITDRFSGTGGGVAATVADTSFPVPMACLQAASTSIGSTCDVNTTANAVLPGSVQTNRRSVWQLDSVQLFDGGPDGLAATAGNGLFATQGILVP